MLKNITFSMGDGRRLRFWKDKWCGNNTLHDSFPSLFDLAVSKDAWVVDCWDSLGEKEGGIPISLDLSMIGRWRGSFRLFRYPVSHFHSLLSLGF